MQLIRRLCITLALTLSSLALAAEPSPEEVILRLRAALDELTVQNQALSARAANLAGDNAALRMEIEKLNTSKEKR